MKKFALYIIKEIGYNNYFAIKANSQRDFYRMLSKYMRYIKSDEDMTEACYNLKFHFITQFKEQYQYR